MLIGLSSKRVPVAVKLQVAAKPKHRQRDNRPEGWVLFTKETSSYTYLHQTPIFNISTKHQHFDQTLTSNFWQNINFITSPSLNSKKLTNFQFQNFAWTSTLNSWTDFVLKVWTKFSFMTKLQLPKLHKTVVKTFLIINVSNSNKLNKFWVGIFTSHTSHQSSLLNRSEWVSATNCCQHDPHDQH